MLDFQQKWKVKTFMHSRWVRGLLLVIAVYSIFSVYRVYEKKRESNRELAKVEQQLIALSAKDVALMRQIDMLQTDQGLEAGIRAKYSVARDNEQVVVLVEDTESPVSTIIETQGIFEKIKSFLGF